MSTTKKNSIILEGAAVYAVSLDSSLRRLQTEYDALMAAKRYKTRPRAWTRPCASCAGWKSM